MKSIAFTLGLVSGVIIFGMAPMAAAQGQLGSLHVQLDGPVKIGMESTNGRLMPGSGVATIGWAFAVVVPTGSICPVPMRMEYKLSVPHPIRGDVRLSHVSQDVAWTGVAGPDLDGGWRRIDGFHVEATIVLDHDAPAFQSFEVGVEATARPLPDATRPCTVSSSAPVRSSAVLTADYVEGFSATVGPWDAGSAMVMAQNEGNDFISVSFAYLTEDGRHVGAAADAVLESRAVNGDKANFQRPADLSCWNWPTDATGDLEIRARPVNDAEEIPDKVIVLQMSPPTTCPAEAGIEETTNPMHELPGAGLWGSLAALGLAAVRRR